MIGAVGFRFPPSGGGFNLAELGVCPRGVAVVEGLAGVGMERPKGPHHLYKFPQLFSSKVGQYVLRNRRQLQRGRLYEIIWLQRSIIHREGIDFR